MQMQTENYLHKYFTCNWCHK